MVKPESDPRKTIRKITRDLENLQFNTCVASLMELSNEIQDTTGDDEATLGALLAMGVVAAVRRFCTRRRVVASHLKVTHA